MSLPPLLESKEHRIREADRFSLILGGILCLLILIPVFIGLAGQGSGLYLQQQTALDDQMVYAAWMKQAAGGSFLFRNLFAIDAQPGLTLNLYFLLLGFASKAFGTLWTLTLARAVFSVLFTWMLGRLLVRLEFTVLQTRLGLVLACLGGGIGWTCWEAFGRVVLGASPTAALTSGRLPIDVWQPEAFVFPSMLTNGLFMASLCLLLTVFRAALDAKDSWRPVVPGALAFLVLMNIHSYDVLLAGLVLLGLAAASLGAGALTGAWIGRVLAMALGALPSAGWFLYVLSQDKVFQSRAATLTFSPTMAQVFAGILPLLAASLAGLWLTREEHGSRTLGAGLITLLAAAGWILGLGHNPDGYFMNHLGFGAAVLLCLAALALGGFKKPAPGLLWAWAILGIAALGYPGLFQRKLAMGLAIPWGLLAAWHAADWLRGLEGSRRRLYGGVACLVCSLSALLWLAREVQLVRQNVSSTTIHSPTLDEGAAFLLRKIEALPGRPILLAMPGVARPDQEKKGSFLEPYLPDLNPMIAGLAGRTAYAGHWSETPDYEKRRGRASAFFLGRTSSDARAAIIAESGASYALAPIPEKFPELPLAVPYDLGRVVERSGRWALVRLAQPSSP